MTLVSDGIAADPRYLDISVPPGVKKTLKVEVDTDLGVFEDTIRVMEEHGRDTDGLFDEPMLQLRNQGQILGEERPGDRLVVAGEWVGVVGAAVAALENDPTFEQVWSFSRSGTEPAVDLTNEESIQRAAQVSGDELDLVIVATGLLHNGSVQPEKAMRDLDGNDLAAGSLKLFGVGGHLPSVDGIQLGREGAPLGVGHNGLEHRSSESNARVSRRVLRRKTDADSWRANRFRAIALRQIFSNSRGTLDA